MGLLVGVAIHLVDANEDLPVFTAATKVTNAPDVQRSRPVVVHMKDCAINDAPIQ